MLLQEYREIVSPITAAPLTSSTLLDGENKRRFYAFRFDLDDATAGAGHAPTNSQFVIDPTDG